MASIVPNKIGKDTYLYESVSYRDENGKPQTRKTSIGKLEPITGQPIYKPEYLAIIRFEGEELPSDAKKYSKDDIMFSTVKEFLPPKSKKNFLRLSGFQCLCR